MRLPNTQSENFLPVPNATLASRSHGGAWSSGEKLKRREINHPAPGGASAEVRVTLTGGEKFNSCDNDTVATQFKLGKKTNGLISSGVTLTWFTH